MNGISNSNPVFSALIAAWALFAEATWAQIPDAPPTPVCSWDSTASPMASTCKFKDAMAGTPTSVVGNRVILYSRGTSGGFAYSRTFAADALKRLATRYGFTATITDSPSIFSSANLADAKVVIMNNGDGDVIPVGPYREAMQDFQSVHGWGVLWIHAACAYITSGWPFGLQSCVQQYFSSNSGGSVRRMFLDSGTAADPNHGIRNPQSEFLLRSLPGWGSSRTLQMREMWWCFQEPARNTPGVNVLFGYDRSSGPAQVGCPQALDSSEEASQNHNMAWTHAMGKGISIYNSWGHDVTTYTENGNMGDSLMWRYIRYAAKDWCVSGSGEPGCDAATALRTGEPMPELHTLQRNGMLVLSLPDAGRYTVSFADVGGRQVYSKTLSGPGKPEIPGLRRGLYLMRVTGEGWPRTQRIMVH